MDGADLRAIGADGDDLRSVVDHRQRGRGWHALTDLGGWAIVMPAISVCRFPLGWVEDLADSRSRVHSDLSDRRDRVKLVGLISVQYLMDARESGQ